ncbi:DoxX family protein [Paraburkholderia sp. 2C]
MQNHPLWVARLLGRRWVLPLLRVALVSAYLVGGAHKLIDFHGAVLEQQHFGLRPGPLWAAAAIAAEVGGSLCVIFNRFVWLGAGALGTVTAVAMLVANDFWNRTGVEHFIALNSFFEHLGLLSAFAMVVWIANLKEFFHHA